MNIYTFKLSKKLIITVALVFVLLIALIILIIPKENVRSTSAAAIKGMTDKEALIDYLETLGYDVSETVWKSRQVVVPQKFDKVYSEYNEIQKECGFDLEDYKGKEITLHTFAITNYKDVSDVLCDLMVYKDKIIGGAIYTADVSGFMHGLKENK